MLAVAPVAPLRVTVKVAVPAASLTVTLSIASVGAFSDRRAADRDGRGVVVGATAARAVVLDRAGTDARHSGSLPDALPIYLEGLAAFVHRVVADRDRERLGGVTDREAERAG